MLRIASRPITSVDVAREAGVSQATVSLVFSGKGAGRVSATTADAVRDAARRLGYRPNAAASALRSGSAAAVGLVVADVTHPFFGRVLRGAQRAAWEAGHVVVLVDAGYGAAWAEGSVETLRAGAIDGFLFFAAEPPASLVGPGGPPIVVVEADHPRLPSVRLDVEKGIDLTMDHLVALGHRRIGRLGSSRRSQTFDRRRARWATRLRALGEDPAEQPEVQTEFDVASMVAAGHALLAGHPTAVVCDDDVLASGLFVAAREAGVRIPEDLSVVGADDLDLAQILAPPLTTVRFAPEELGAAACRALLARLRGGRPRSRVLDVELVVRDSTAPAPG